YSFRLLLMLVRLSPTSTLFPYTTLFRSPAAANATRTASARDRCRLTRVKQFSRRKWSCRARAARASYCNVSRPKIRTCACRPKRSEEHTSELQSPDHLVCRLLLEKKKQN